MCSGWLGSYGGGCGGAGALRRLMASSLVGSACVPCIGWASAVLWVICRQWWVGCGPSGLSVRCRLDVLVSATCPVGCCHRLVTATPSSRGGLAPLCGLRRVLTCVMLLCRSREGDSWLSCLVIASRSLLLWLSGPMTRLS